jgi:hypothetical protein
MLSKLALPLLLDTENIQNEFIEKKSPKILKNENKTNKTLTYSEYVKNKTILKKYKIPELKSIAKNLRLFITGSKSILIERIEIYFEQFSKIIKIQRIFRGFIVRKSFQLRGEAFKNLSICVNNTDFYTLEPLAEIDFELFFSYKDDNNFCYGFNITSLIQLMKNKTVDVLNPYNRDNISNQIKKTIFSLYNKIHILFPLILEPENDSNSNIKRPIINTDITNNRHSYINNSNITLVQEIQNKITRIRETPIPNRMIELFMEIDQLGNYTDSTWFSSLNIRDYVKLYRSLYDIWNYRAQLSSTMKNNICILGNPFLNIFNERIYYNDVSLHRIQEACLIVIENMVYTGIDIEHRKIGTMHALSALTTVSLHFRDAMPWLYESVVFN